MKKKQYSFADEAKRLQKLYSRRETDPIEKADYEQAMRSLVEEQEAVRTEMGMGEPQQQYQYGGEYPTGWGSTVPLTGDYNGLYEDNRNLLQRWGDSAYGLYETNKPQLFKDFPITDIVGTGLQYITGNTPDTGMQTGMPGFLPTMGAGAYPNAGSYLDDASKFVGDPSGISQLVKRSTKVGRNIQPNTRLSNIEATKTYVPAVSRFKTANQDLVEGAKRTSEKISAYKATQKELDKAFGSANKSKGTAKIGNLDVTTRGGIPSNVQMINGKLYQIDPTTGTKIPWKNIGYGATGVGASGAGLYGVSQLNPYEPSSTQQPINNPLDLSGYNIDEVYGYINSLYGNGPLHPNQLAARGKPWNRPNTEEPTTRNTTQTTPTARNTSKKIGSYTIPEEILNTPIDTRYMDEEARRVIEGIAKRISPRREETAADINKQEVEKLKSTKTKKTPYNPKESWWDKNKKYLPVAAAGASTILGNLLMSNMANKNLPRVQPAYATPKEINMAPMEEELKREAITAKNIAARNYRNLGVNRGAAIAGMNTAGSMIDTGLGKSLSGLYTQESMFNADAANRMSMFNAQNRSRADMINAQLQGQALDNRLGYFSGALGAIPGMAREYNLMNRNEETMKWWEDYLGHIGQNYGIGNPFSGGPQLELR